MTGSGAFPTPFQHISLPDQNRPQQASQAASTSLFSITSTMENRIFRDGGRRFQASNDDYALPADEEEERRLNIQHRGWKATNGGKNYVAPMDKVLVNVGEGKRVIDIGTGTGIWAVEMAREFPKAEVVGLDLVPYATNELDLPTNLELVLGDCAQGLAYPDGHFDIVHARLIVGGIRDWKALLDEVVRITKPGGLMVFAESCCPWPLIDPAPEGAGRGFVDFMGLVAKACTIRGLDINAGNLTLPSMMSVHPGIKNFHQEHVNCPLHPWSTDTQRKEAGTIMLGDAKMMPETFRLMCIDACGLSTDEYDIYKKGFIQDLGDDRVHSALHMWHNWGWRV